MGLKADVRDQLVQGYESQDGSFDIRVSFGMGDFGTILTFFASTPGAGESVLATLKQVVETEVAPAFTVTPCSSIEGFKTPILYK
jgi:hypothetical protein